MVSKLILPFVSVSAILLLGAASFGLANTNKIERNVVVTDKERVCSTSNDCQYLIFTDDTTLTNTDSIWHGKFNSSDIYGQITVGEQYTFTTVGYRFGLMSMYPNIIDVEEMQ